MNAADVFLHAGGGALVVVDPGGMIGECGRAWLSYHRVLEEFDEHFMFMLRRDTRYPEAVIKRVLRRCHGKIAEATWILTQRYDALALCAVLDQSPGIFPQDVWLALDTAKGNVAMALELLTR